MQVPLRSGCFRKVERIKKRMATLRAGNMKQIAIAVNCSDLRLVNSQVATKTCFSLIYPKGSP
ncbi:MAG: hypothetical protein JWR68_1734 [Polaromonas sp.]|nr:hypothetical protein [Polaromonas sp.]